MKHVYLVFVLLLLARAGLAQNLKTAPGGGGTPVLPERPNHYTHVVDSLLRYVDKAGVGSGLLYDRAMPLAQLHAFDPATDASSARHFRQAYLELFPAA